MSKSAMDLAAHLDLVPEEVREEIKLTLATTRVRSYQDFTDLAQFFMAKIAVGEIPPEAADAARKYMELMFQALVMDNTENPEVSANFGASDVAKRLLEAGKLAEQVTSPVHRTVKEVR